MFYSTLRNNNLLLQSYINNDFLFLEKLEKASTMDWKTVVNKKTGKSFQRRYRSKVDEGDNHEENKKSWERSSLAAGLKDKLIHSIKYEGNYYDTKGEKIDIPERYKAVIEEKYHSGNSNNKAGIEKVYSKDSVDKEKERADKSLPELKKRLDIRKDIEKQHEEKYNDQQSKIDTSHYISNIKKSLSKINEKNNSLSNIYNTLLTIRGTIKDDIDPTLSITHKGKKQDITLGEMMSRLKKTITEGYSKNDQTKIHGPNEGLSSIEVKDLEDYNREDFNQISFNSYLKGKKTHIDNAVKKEYKKRHGEEMPETLVKKEKDSK